MNRLLNNKLIIIIFISVFFFIFYFYNISGYDLWSPDEPRYAEVAREMIVLNEYILPHLNGDIYYQKPPVFFLEIVTVAKLLNIKINSVSARLPSVISAVIILIFTYWITYNYTNSIVALLSVLILGTTVEFWWLATRAQIDMSLALTTTSAGFLLFLGSNKDTGIFNFKFFLAFLIMGVGTLIKGPVSLFPLISFILYYIVTNGLKSICKIKIFRYFVIYILIVLVWLVPALYKGGKKYYNNTIVKQTAGRMVNSHSHKKPIYYYIKNFPGQSLPWSLIFISTFILALKTKIYKTNKFISFNFIWFISIFLIFSLISGKRGLYLLQLYPAFSILTAYFIYKFSEKFYNWITIPGIITGVLFLIASCLLPYLVKNRYPLFFKDSIILSIIFFISGASLLIFSYKRKISVIMITNIIFILCLGFFVKHSLFPKINQFKSAKNTGETIKKLQKQGKKIYLLNDKSFAGGFMLYSENFLNITDDTQKLIRLFNSDNIVLLVENDKLQKFKNKLLPYKIIFRDLVGHSDMIILEKK